MNINDLGTKLTATSHVNIAAKTSTVTATGMDISGYKGSLVLSQNVGPVSGTTPTLDGKWQKSSDNSSWSDITGATHAQVTASNNLSQINVDVRDALKYIRYVGTIAGTTPSFTMGVTVQGMKERT